jgi:hypothetical protein
LEIPMDGFRFDGLSRSVAEAGSRRRLVHVLGGLVLGGWFAVPAMREAAGKGKKGKKGKGKGKKRRTSPCRPSCERKICGDDGCGGTCGACEDGFACDGGRCVCAQPRVLMCGGCIDPSRDPRHCGRCDVACGGGQPVCDRGMCCNPELSACNCAPPGSACTPATCCQNLQICQASGICP